MVMSSDLDFGKRKHERRSRIKEKGKKQVTAVKVRGGITSRRLLLLEIYEEE
jgi:hypothetical protein